jgi:hypothetical protein
VTGNFEGEGYAYLKRFVQAQDGTETAHRMTGKPLRVASDGSSDGTKFSDHVCTKRKDNGGENKPKAGVTDL